MKFDKIIQRLTVFVALCAVPCANAIPLPYWAPGKMYTKTISADEIKFEKIEADGWEGDNLVFSGQMAYTTQRTGYQKAQINFQNAELLRLEVQPTFKNPENIPWWKFWKDKSITPTKTDIGMILGTTAFNEDTRKEFNDKSFYLTWDSDDVRGGRIWTDENSQHDAPRNVTDFLGTELKFSYQSLMAFRPNGAKDWKIDADLLTGLVPQNMLKGGKFEGEVWVREINATPTECEEDPELKNHDAKIIILREHEEESPEIDFIFNSDDKKEQRIHVSPRQFSGKIYVNFADELIESASLEIVSAEYSGDMPQIGDFKEKNIKTLRANVSLKFTFTQKSAKTQK